MIHRISVEGPNCYTRGMYACMGHPQSGGQNMARKSKKDKAAGREQHRQLQRAKRMKEERCTSQKAQRERIAFCMHASMVSNPAVRVP